MNRIMLANGQTFSYTDPQPEDINLGTIAHSLSMICRFNGHISKHYSVAQHSVLCSLQAKTPYGKLKMLFHDAAEAYTGDVVTPLKHLLIGYEDIENRIMDVVSKKYGFDWAGGMEPELKNIDKRMLATEIKFLINKKWHKHWDIGVINYPDLVIKPWSRSYAKNAFIKRYMELCNGDSQKPLLGSPNNLPKVSRRNNLSTNSKKK